MQEPLAAAPLTPEDLAGANALVAECGWNQVREDWEVFLREGAGWKVSVPGTPVAATAAILPYGQRFGWISMVLVTNSQRRKGIASRLIDLCVARLRERGAIPVLDATPAGREVYRQQGFRDGFAITRWRRVTGPVSPPAQHAGVQALQEEDWADIARLDAQAFGEDRLALLQSLASRSAQLAAVARSGGRLRGFVLGRNGRIATQVGPLVAEDDATASALLAHAISRIEGVAIIDTVDQHVSLPEQLRGAGFTVERGYTRMAFQHDVDFGDTRLLRAIAGPELG